MITRQPQLKKKTSDVLGKVKNYNEVVEFLDAQKASEYGQASLKRMKQLDKQLGNISSKIDTVLVGGTNGKSSTIHFAGKLLKEEGFRVGTAYSSHILTYNERIGCDFVQVSNKDFAEVVSEIISVAQTNNIDATTQEIMIFASLRYFLNQKMDIVLFEVGYGGKFDATTIFNPKIAAVTRVTEDGKGLLGSDLDEMSFEMLEIARPGTWFISAEQSKLRLQKMKDWCVDRQIQWAMPIRKLASLPYIYEQLYGRVASLGERIAQIYVEDIRGKFSPFLRGNLLATQRGQRGRPTLEAKRQAELNPIKTLKVFWDEQFDLLRGRFEYLDKEKPSILLDNANNLDAFENLFLGIRLLHYQKPLKGLVLIIGLSKALNSIEAIKLLRYLLKKVSGHIFFVPLPGSGVCHDPEDLANLAKELNVKAKAYQSFTKAFEQAKSLVDERDGLIVTSGSEGIVTEYWKQRGMKKF